MATRTVWKYPLEITDVQTLKMPAGAEVLSVHRQGDALCLWAVVDPKMWARGVAEARQFAIVGTGNPFEYFRGYKFVGTVVMDPFVWHVWEVT